MFMVTNLVQYGISPTRGGMDSSQWNTKNGSPLCKTFPTTPLFLPYIGQNKSRWLLALGCALPTGLIVKRWGNWAEKTFLDHIDAASYAVTINVRMKCMFSNVRSTTTPDYDSNVSSQMVVASHQRILILPFGMLNCLIEACVDLWMETVAIPSGRI